MQKSEAAVGRVIAAADAEHPSAAAAKERG
jgi:hypothetical protein